MSGQLRLVLSVPTTLMLQDIAADGRVLLLSADARFRVAGRAAGATREQDLSWYEYTLLNDLSSDGQKILVEEQSAIEGPNYSVGMRSLDGSAPIRLGEGYGGGFSPDGKWALSFIPGPPPKITILPTGLANRGPWPFLESSGSSLCAWAFSPMENESGSLARRPTGPSALICRRSVVVRHAR